MGDIGPVRLHALDEHMRPTYWHGEVYSFTPVVWHLVTVRPRPKDGKHVYCIVPFTAYTDKQVSIGWGPDRAEGCLDAPEGPERRLRARLDFDNAFRTLEWIFTGGDPE